MASRLPPAIAASEIPMGISVPIRPRLGPTRTSMRGAVKLRRTRSSCSNTKCSSPPPPKVSAARCFSTSCKRRRSDEGNWRLRASAVSRTLPDASQRSKLNPERSRRRMTKSTTQRPAIKRTAMMHTHNNAKTGKRRTWPNANKPFSSSGMRFGMMFSGASTGTKRRLQI